MVIMKKNTPATTLPAQYHKLSVFVVRGPRRPPPCEFSSVALPRPLAPTSISSDITDPIVTTNAESTPSPKPPEPFKPPEEPNIFDKPFIPTKPFPHSPKISPSSIPNPSPSVTTTKQVEPGYPTYGGYLYSIPGYSAFQPVNYQNTLPQPQPETTSDDFMPFPKSVPKENISVESQFDNKPIQTPPLNLEAKPQTDFEEHFTPEIVAPPTKNNSNNVKPVTDIINVSNKIQAGESMSITSLSQGSGATVTIPPQINNTETKKKPVERFSLKTSIPISKIDMKCVIPQDNTNQNKLSQANKANNLPFQTNKTDAVTKIEIQSNIVIKNAITNLQQPENRPDDNVPVSVANNNINTLINAVEAVNKHDKQFWRPDAKTEIIKEIKDPPPVCSPSNPPKPIFNPMNIETNKHNFTKSPESAFNEQKNQIVFIQNKNASNPKMLLTIQQPNPQVLLQRTNFDPKNLQAPSRLLNPSKKTKEEIVSENTSKVVALKRTHQENCDENDFENLITENQIYGNKIVVKEKSQGTSQEQDLKNKSKQNEKQTQGETKNVVIQPNIVYLSNVQFPANLMMIKNTTKVNPATTEANINKNIAENRFYADVSTNTVNSEANVNSKIQNIQNVTSKEIHLTKTNNNIIQTLTHKNNKQEMVIQTNQKVIMNSQIVYQVPMIVDGENKYNQTFVNPNIIQNKKDFLKPFEQSKSGDKLFIACPYQMDAKLQPKIVITNIRPNLPKIEELSSLDMYEKKRRLRRMKYLLNRELKDSTEKQLNQVKENQKIDIKKSDRVDGINSVITPDKMRKEVYREFSENKVATQDSSDSESDYGEEDLREYNNIINQYTDGRETEDLKKNFLANFNLGSHKVFMEKDLDRLERIIKQDAVASAYISAGRIDKLLEEKPISETVFKIDESADTKPRKLMLYESGISLRKKQIFLAHLQLTRVSSAAKEEYERVWQEVIKERKRRNGEVNAGQVLKRLKSGIENLEIDPSSQMQLLTQIKNSVNENNNLIKMRLDSSNKNYCDSIHTLAEKNFSELNRLSKMAENSVKIIISGKETRKRDLNPGFDSENIKKPTYTIKQPFHNYPQINIPSVAKIISLKTSQELTSVNSTQATSMDEPKNSAAGVETMSEPVAGDKVRDFTCQVVEALPWPGVEAIIKSYKEYDTARKREIQELHRRNTSLRVETAQASRGAACASDCARALANERRALANEHNLVKAKLEKLWTAIDVIRNY